MFLSAARLVQDRSSSRVLFYRATSLIRNTPLLGAYSRTLPRFLWWSYEGGLFLMGEVPLYTSTRRSARAGLLPLWAPHCKREWPCAVEFPLRCPPRQKSRVERLRARVAKTRLSYTCRFRSECLTCADFGPDCLICADFARLRDKHLIFFFVTLEPRVE